MMSMRPSRSSPDPHVLWVSKLLIKFICNHNSMSFESPGSPDEEQEKMKGELINYFRTQLDSLEEGGVHDGQTEINEVLNDLERNEFESTSKYLANELERLKERKVEIRGSISEQDTLRVIESARIKTQKLWDSLQLKEK